MNRVRCALAVMLSCGLLSAACGETYTPGQKVDKDFGGFAQPFLSSHCVECHGSKEPAGNLSLHGRQGRNQALAASPRKPTGATIPNPARCARIAFTSMVR